MCTLTPAPCSHGLLSFLLFFSFFYYYLISLLFHFYFNIFIYSILFYFILFYSILFYFILFYFTLFYSILFNFYFIHFLVYLCIHFFKISNSTKPYLLRTKLIAISRCPSPRCILYALTTPPSLGH